MHTYDKQDGSNLNEEAHLQTVNTVYKRHYFTVFLFFFKLICLTCLSEFISFADLFLAIFPIHPSCNKQFLCRSKSLPLLSNLQEAVPAPEAQQDSLTSGKRMVLVSSARRGRWENVSHQDRKISQMLPETLQRGG